MRLKLALGVLGWTLLLLAWLLTGCAHTSPASPPVPPPALPALPTEARQISSPIYSVGAQSDISMWLESLTRPSSPGPRASGPIGR